MTVSEPEGTSPGEGETQKRSIPRLVIGGTHSGCGKTTVASGLMAALTARGLRVQPFKTGPDFIDPTHHTRICGRPSRNLDPFMMGEQGVLETFCRSSEGADIAVIEGVMGLYDGMDGTGYASTAHVAQILGAPVVLVADARGMSRSVHALVQGFRAFDPRVTIAGIVVNRVGSPRHRAMIEQGGSGPFVGWIPRKEELSVKSRHLGLAMAHEEPSMVQFGEIVREHCDLDALVRIAGGAPALDCPGRVSLQDTECHARIGIAWDPAFCFYYQDNLDRLRSEGADLVFFSPLSDRLPEVDGIYLGGGYPELHLEELSASRCRSDILRAADAGTPIYGECGGLMYLSAAISSGRSYRMCGVLPAASEMTGKVQALGYINGTTNGTWTCIPEVLPIHGHEFHYSRVLPDRDARYAILLRRGKGIDGNRDGLVQGSAIGTYAHAYFSQSFSRALVSCCARTRVFR